MRARHESTCPGCNSQVLIGDRIARCPGNLWFHLACFPRPQAQPRQHLHRKDVNVTTRTRITDNSIAAVREFSPIAEIIGQHVELRGAGGGSLKGLCPFRADCGPAFAVTPGRSLWYCMACQEGGDVIKFVQKIHDLGFAEAVELLAHEAGIALEYEPSQHLADWDAIRHLDWHSEDDHQCD